MSDVVNNQKLETPYTLSSLQNRQRPVYNPDLTDEPVVEPEPQPEPNAQIPEPEAAPVQPEPVPDVIPPADATPDEPLKDKKYKTWEAAEEGAKEAQRWATKEAQKAADLAKELATAKAELAEKEKREREAARPKPPTKEEQQAKLKTALTAIDELDPEASDYAERRAEILAEALAVPAVPYVDEAAIEEKIRAEIDAKEVERTKKAQETQQTIFAETYAKEQGLDMTPGSRDYKMFWDALNRAPVGEGVTLQQQVDFMVGEVTQFKEDYRKEVLKSLENAKDTQTQNAVLEHGARVPQSTPPDEPAQPKTISSIIESTRRRRVV